MMKRSDWKDEVWRQEGREGVQPIFFLFFSWGRGNGFWFVVWMGLGCLRAGGCGTWLRNGGKGGGFEEVRTWVGGLFG